MEALKAEITLKKNPRTAIPSCLLLFPSQGERGELALLVSRAREGIKGPGAPGFTSLLGQEGTSRAVPSPSQTEAKAALIKQMFLIIV